LSKFPGEVQISGRNPPNHAWNNRRGVTNNINFMIYRVNLTSITRLYLISKPAICVMQIR